MHRSLYRKYRPQTFFDIVGQEHITSTLKNEIMSGKVAHAYLFTGTRGTGKTTCAKIFAKAVNCENPVEGNPCNKCSVCNGIQSGEIMDIIEMDAASNNGVDDVRELREDVIYSPSVSKYKVYIIDEVHMLSSSAFNALLKTLEEPPAHVIFILATTEINKIPMTILSRCQRFDFRRLTVEEISSRLKYICTSEKIEATDDALSLIARLGDGSVRDAISILDQCAGAGEKLTVEFVEKMTQSAGRAVLFSLAETVNNKDFGASVSVLSDLYYSSRDFTRLNEDLVTFYRDLMMVKTVPDPSGLVICSEDDMKCFRKLAEKTDGAEIIKNIDILQQSLERMPRTVNKRVALEMAFLKMTETVVPSVPYTVETVSAPAVKSTIKQEKPTETVKTAPVTENAPLPEPPTDDGIPMPDSPPWENENVTAPEPHKTENPASENAKTETVKKSSDTEKWKNVLDNIKKSGKIRLWALLVGSTAEIKNGKLVVTAKNAAATDTIAEPDTQTAISAAVSEVYGESMPVVTAESEKKRASLGADAFSDWFDSNKSNIEQL